MKKHLKVRDMTHAEFTRFSAKSYSNFVSDASAASGESLESVAARVGRPPETPHKDDVWRVIEIDENIAGYFWIRLDRENKMAFGYDIILYPEYRGVGIGREVMCRAMDELKSKGISTLQLCVFCKNKVARSLYESLGFQEVKRNSEKEQITMEYTYR